MYHLIVCLFVCFRFYQIIETYTNIVLFTSFLPSSLPSVIILFYLRTVMSIVRENLILAEMTLPPRHYLEGLSMSLL